jgi:hypothetical protein
MPRFKLYTCTIQVIYNTHTYMMKKFIHEFSIVSFIVEN